LKSSFLKSIIKGLDTVLWLLSPNWVLQEILITIWTWCDKNQRHLYLCMCLWVFQRILVAIIWRVELTTIWTRCLYYVTLGVAKNSDGNLENQQQLKSKAFDLFMCLWRRFKGFWSQSGQSDNNQRSRATSVSLDASRSCNWVVMCITCWLE
jgi:hypothetical protein